MKPLARIAELLEHQWPYTMAVLRRRFGLPEYSTTNAADEIPVDWVRLMEEPPRPGRAGGTIAADRESGVAL